ncbi:unnamed protein product [Sphagnum tenellum]
MMSAIDLSGVDLHLRCRRVTYKESAFQLESARLREDQELEAAHQALALAVRSLLGVGNNKTVSKDRGTGNAGTATFVFGANSTTMRSFRVKVTYYTCDSKDK